MIGNLGRLTFALVVGACVVAAWMTWRIWETGNRDERRPVDSIVVLGAAQYNGVPSAVFAARLQHAVELYHQGIAKVFVVTGGKLPGDRYTEAQTARAYALAHGVPRSAILAENNGRNTLESIEAVGAILRSHHLDSAVFVSDRTHMLRVLRMATDLGIVSFGSPTRTSPTDLETSRRTQAMVHEIGGLLAYYVGGGRLFGDTSTGAAP